MIILQIFFYLTVKITKKMLTTVVLCCEKLTQSTNGMTVTRNTQNPYPGIVTGRDYSIDCADKTWESLSHLRLDLLNLRKTIRPIINN
jgi:hypothetical protein